VHHPALIELGQRIRDHRKAKGWTQEDFADKAELDRSYIGGIERGERNISFTILYKLCEALGCDVAELTQGIPGGAK
jgi:transcriptional regulator with XRE-family HTH domain